MALTPEDGSQVAGANTYATVAEADAYFALRGKTAAWDAVTDKESALILAADYLAQAYGSRWAGTRVSATQEMDWPRSGVMLHSFVYSDAAVPVAVQSAQIELALKAASGELLPDSDRRAIKRQKLDVLEIEYSGNQVEGTIYKAVDAILKHVLDGSKSGASAPVVRV